VTRDRAVLALVAGVGGACVALGIRVCPFALVTGFPCPGCGLSRASLALLSGDPVRAFHFHPLVFVVLPVAAFLVVRLARFHGTTGSAPRDNRATVLGAAVLLVLMLGVWVARFAGALGGPVAVN